MGKHNIEKFSLSYKILYYWVKAVHDSLYSTINIYNKYSPNNKPHMFALNHQNALMDAMATLYATSQIQVFLARSDIFKNPKTAAILYFLRVLPIYRIRDGFENLKNNDEVFNNSVRVLNTPCTLTILPEGNHAGYKRLRPLQKGFGRIAFMAMKKRPDYKQFYIVPIGLDYQNYEKFGTELTVNYGKPIEISEYYRIYTKNPTQGLNELRDRLSSELKKLIINIESERWYYLALKLTELNRIRSKLSNPKPETVYKQNIKLAEKISKFDTYDQTAINLEEKCQKLDQYLANNKLQPEEIADKNSLLVNIIKIILLTPPLILSIPAMIMLGWLFYTGKMIVNKKVKDPQFRTSVRYVIYAVISLPLIIIINIWTIFLFPWYIYVAAVIITAISWLLFLKIVPQTIRTCKKIKTGLLDLLGDKKTKSLISLRNEIFNEIEIINQ